MKEIDTLTTTTKVLLAEIALAKAIICGLLNPNNPSEYFQLSYPKNKKKLKLKKVQVHT